MPAMRVHELAKEFGMSSKELLDRLQELKIPAKNGEFIPYVMPGYLGKEIEFLIGKLEGVLCFFNI